MFSGMVDHQKNKKKKKKEKKFRLNFPFFLSLFS